VDATLAWEVIGSGAGVAGVIVGAVAAVSQVRSSRKSGSKISAELAAGQLDNMGVLYVEYASGKTDVMTLPKPGKPRVSEKRGSKKAKNGEKLNPVNVIFIRNQGHSSVTVSRCHYVSDLGGVGFSFEPQPAASKRGDHLPIPLAPGQDAVLVHDYASMRLFLNHVLRDHNVDTAVFKIVLTIGDGKQVTAYPSMLIRADMSQQELAAPGPKVVRQEITRLHTYTRRRSFLPWH
jgi:hypothetical protein